MRIYKFPLNKKVIIFITPFVSYVKWYRRYDDQKISTEYLFSHELRFGWLWWVFILDFKKES